MGYPVHYRNASGRAKEGGFQGPQPSPNPVRPANDNHKIPRTPANTNYPSRLPPLPEARFLKPAARVAKQFFKIHPFFRIAFTAWDIWDLFWHYKRVGLTLGDYTIACDVGWGTGCDVPPDVVCGENYCFGPTFARGINNPALCGIAGQAGFGGLGYFANYLFWDGVITWAHRPVFGGLCHPGKMITQYRRTVGNDSTPGLLRPPQRVPWIRTAPPPYAPYRWYKPEIFLRPHVDYDVTPLPPPYDVIPDRNDADRGYAVPTPEAEPVPQVRFDPRYRPPPRTKEKKVKWNGATNILQAILVSLARVHGKLLDLRDILGAMNDALPKEYKLKGKQAKSIPDLLRNLFRHLDKMDGEKALLNIIKEIAEDVVGGTSDQLRSEISKNFGWFKTKTFTSARF